MISEIRPYYKGYCKVYTKDYEAKQKIASWQSCKQSNTYYNRYGQLMGWDLIFFSKLYNRVAKLVNLPQKGKNSNRLRHGQTMANKNRQHQFKG